MREGEMKGSFEGRLGRGEGAHRFRQSDGLEDGRVRGARTTRKTQGERGIGGSTEVWLRRHSLPVR